MIDEANAALGEMVADGSITAEERSRMTVGNYPRRKRDLLAPFAANGEFQQLTMEDCEMVELPDAAWTDYQRDRNKEALVTKHVLFFRSIFVPSLASALGRVRAGHTEALRAFGDHALHPARFAGQGQRIELAARAERAIPDVHAPLLAQTRGA